MIRKLVSRFNRSVTKQIVAARREFHIPIKISISRNKHGKLTMRLPIFRGETMI